MFVMLLLKDTEGVCGGDCQHPPGVVSVWIHAEEELQAQQQQRQAHKHKTDWTLTGSDGEQVVLLPTRSPVLGVY